MAACVDTELPDLAGVTLEQLRCMQTAEAQRRVLEQVQTPRVNLGGSSPPGRAD